MNRIRHFAQTLALLLLWPIQVAAMDGDSVSKSVPIPTVTRLVKLAGELERSLQSAVTAGDKSRIESLLADNFEMWTGPKPGEPIPRTDWIRQALSHPELTSTRTVEQIAVHDFGEIAVASFKWTGAPDLFVVDVWKVTQGHWKLVTRYASATGSADQAIPGSDQKGLPFDKKE